MDIDELWVELKPLLYLAFVVVIESTKVGR